MHHKLTRLQWADSAPAPLVPLNVTGTLCIRLNPPVNNTNSKNPTVGWSDFHFLAIFENLHIAVDWLHLFCSIPKKQRPKKLIFFRKFADITSMNNRQKEN